ncbi:hypothetical protein [Salinibacter ruber]|uniref:hypothetical protein n=1 Tax=Salinibacter ruber TaxID=146919 RepID=UPI0020731EFE|nr:hypothetical protein [Salinibacter ruber]
MGKYVLLIVLGAAGVWALAQQQTEMQTAEKRAERGEKVLARQAARTGFNAILAKTRTVAQDKCPDEVVSSINSISGTHETDGYDRGTYKGWLEDASSVDFGYRAHAKGQFNGATVTFDRLIRGDNSRAGLVYGKEGNGKLQQTTSDGSEEFGSAPQIRGIGALATDLDGDGKDEVPYIRKANQKIEMIDEDASNQGDTQELVGSNAQEGVPADQKTRLSTGMWKSGQPSVFYPNEDNEAIYRTWWGNGGRNSGNGNNGNGNNGGGSDNIEKVRSPGNGAQAVLGIDDIDGDNEAELVFADASQQVRYIEEPGGTIEKLENGGIGSSAGIGAGSLVDLNGDGTASAIFVNGSNNLRVVDADGTDRTIYLDDGSDDGAAKAPPTAIDLDNDDELEIAYLRNESDGPDIEYVNADGSNIRTLCGISVEKGAGLQSAE